MITISLPCVAPLNVKTTLNVKKKTITAKCEKAKCEKVTLKFSVTFSHLM